ncbi:MAG: SDR family oxidoreductase [Alphaproteobacteria bacterium]|nr:SDR family oxidoreductase [Alphaproteobacteria bacterium]
MTDETRPVCLITGASRGIGAATAIKAAGAGYDLVLNYAENAEAAQSVAADCHALGAEVALVQADVGTAAGVQKVFAESDRVFGRLDAVIPNAGITGTASALVDASIETIQHTIDLNVTGAILTVQEGLKRMLISKGGRGGSVVMLSSAAVWIGSPDNFTWYAASKGAIDSFVLGLGREVSGDGVRVNAVAPGLIETDIHASGGLPDRLQKLSGSVPIGRSGTADEVADAILYLMSDEARYIAGAVLRVTGGR